MVQGCVLPTTIEEHTEDYRNKHKRQELFCGVMEQAGSSGGAKTKRRY